MCSQETGLYYLQSRYYSPKLCRFIGADNQLATKHLTGVSLFVYCNNNPVMCVDPSGMAPEWWQWAISSTMFVAGVILVATGVGGTAGGALICSGVNSIIGSYTAEATGGSSTAGWVGGTITGLICGAGAGIAGDIMLAATEISGVACLGKTILGLGVAFGIGTGGSLAGQYATAAIDRKAFSWTESLPSALATGTINMFAAVGAGMGSAMKGLPGYTTTSTALASALNVMCGVGIEAICDTLGFVISLFD